MKFKSLSSIDCPLLCYCYTFSSCWNLTLSSHSSSSKNIFYLGRLAEPDFGVTAWSSASGFDNQPSVSVDSNPLVITDYLNFPASCASDDEHNHKSAERHFRGCWAQRHRRQRQWWQNVSAPCKVAESSAWCPRQLCASAGMIRVMSWCFHLYNFKVWPI